MRLVLIVGPDGGLGRWVGGAGVNKHAGGMTRRRWSGGFGLLTVEKVV